MIPYLRFIYYAYCVCFQIKKGYGILKMKQEEINVFNNEVYGYSRKFETYRKHFIPIIESLHRNDAKK